VTSGWARAFQALALILGLYLLLMGLRVAWGAWSQWTTRRAG
jgi:hypothetical protein